MFAGSALCVVVGTAWGANILLNGTFTGSTYTDTFGTVVDILPANWYDAPPTPSTLSNLNRVAASAYPGFADPAGAGFYVAFKSGAQNDSQDCFFQDIPTVPGQTYTLSFDAALTAASPYLELVPDWDANGTERQKLTIPGFNVSAGPTQSQGPIAFRTYTFTNLTASMSTTRLYFHGVDSAGAILLTNISLTPQSSVAIAATDGPLPLWSLGALGSCLIGVVSLRRGRESSQWRAFQSS